MSGSEIQEVSPQGSVVQKFPVPSDAESLQGVAVAGGRLFTIARGATTGADEYNNPIGGPSRMVTYATGSAPFEVTLADGGLAGGTDLGVLGPGGQFWGRFFIHRPGVRDTVGIQATNPLTGAIARYPIGVGDVPAIAANTTGETWVLARADGSLHAPTQAILLSPQGAVIRRVTVPGRGTYYTYAAVAGTNGSLWVTHGGDADNLGYVAYITRQGRLKLYNLRHGQVCHVPTAISVSPHGSLLYAQYERDCGSIPGFGQANQFAVMMPNGLTAPVAGKMTPKVTQRMLIGGGQTPFATHRELLDQFGEAPDGLQIVITWRGA